MKPISSNIGPRTAFLFLSAFLLTLPSIAAGQDSNQAATSPRLRESPNTLNAVPADISECALPKGFGSRYCSCRWLCRRGRFASATLGSQDIPTEAGNVIIENGDGPLYIVIVATRPVIWRITGAVGRIERLILSSFHPYAPQIPADVLISIAGYRFPSPVRPASRRAKLPLCPIRNASGSSSME